MRKRGTHFVTTITNNSITKYNPCSISSCYVSRLVKRLLMKTNRLLFMLIIRTSTRYSNYWDAREDHDKKQYGPYARAKDSAGEDGRVSRPSKSSSASVVVYNHPLFLALLRFIQNAAHALLLLLPPVYPQGRIYLKDSSESVSLSFLRRPRAKDVDGHVHAEPPRYSWPQNQTGGKMSNGRVLVPRLTFPGL